MRRLLQPCGLLAALVLATACVGPQPAGDAASQRTSPGVATPKRITVAIMSDPGTMVSGFGGQGGAPGIDTLQEMTNAGLANVANDGRLRPQIAEAVPSLENGLWKLSPDGRMETTWRLKAGVQWHDGTPFTSDDLAFAARFWQDDDLPISHDIALDSIESVATPDSRSVVVTWKRPFIDADTLFTPERVMPLPRHLVEKPYQEDKAGIAQLPYWSDGFVGTGPYRLREWQRGSHLILAAYDSYVLGRPKIDEIEVRFVPSAEALIANILSGSIDVTMGRNLSLEQGSVLLEQWRDGGMELAFRNWFGIYPQFLDPNPAIIRDVRFRRALISAIDRQALVDSLMGGKTSVAHTYLSPNDPDYAAIGPSIVRYEYDPRRAAQLIEELGYTQTPGGFRDAAGQPLSVEIRTTGEEDIGVKSTLSAADAWSRIGVAVDPVMIPPARARDREYRANFPSFQILQQPNSSGDLRYLHGSAARIPPDYAGRNQSRYMSPEFDRLLDAYYSTVRREQRTQLLGEIVRHISDQLNVMGLFYNVNTTMVSKRMLRVTPGSQNATQAWNVEEWDVQ